MLGRVKSEMGTHQIGNYRSITMIMENQDPARIGAKSRRPCTCTINHQSLQHYTQLQSLPGVPGGI